MLQDLNDDQRLLEALMSDISEMGFCAGWMMGLEFDLWRIINGGDNRYGHHILTQAEIDQLRFLSDKCNCWIIYDDQTEETAVVLETWKLMYAQKRQVS